jgi:starvation-inducible DNA-binding protein
MFPVRRFRELHLLFDEQAVAIFGQVDLIAERVRKNGARKTLTSIGSVAKSTRVTDQDSNSLVPTR